MTIAPYITSNVQRSYLRQQRIGERIAELKGAVPPDAPTPPATQVDISEAALATSRTGRKDLGRVREEQLDQLSERFVQKFLEVFRKEGSGAPAAAPEETPGGPSFEHILQNLGISVQQSPDGKSGMTVRKATGEILLQIPPEAQELAVEDLRKLARDILKDLI